MTNATVGDARFLVGALGIFVALRAVDHGRQRQALDGGRLRDRLVAGDAGDGGALAIALVARVRELEVAGDHPPPLGDDQRLGDVALGAVLDGDGRQRGARSQVARAVAARAGGVAAQPRRLPTCLEQMAVAAADVPAEALLHGVGVEVLLVIEHRGAPSLRTLGRPGKQRRFSDGAWLDGGVARITKIRRRLEEAVAMAAVAGRVLGAAGTAQRAGRGIAQRVALGAGGARRVQRVIEGRSGARGRRRARRRGFGACASCKQRNQRRATKDQDPPSAASAAFYYEGGPRSLLVASDGQRGPLVSRGLLSALARSAMPARGRAR